MTYSENFRLAARFYIENKHNCRDHDVVLDGLEFYCTELYQGDETKGKALADRVVREALSA